MRKEIHELEQRFHKMVKLVEDTLKLVESEKSNSRQPIFKVEHILHELNSLLTHLKNQKGKIDLSLSCSDKLTREDEYDLILLYIQTVPEMISTYHFIESIYTSYVTVIGSKNLSEESYNFWTSGYMMIGDGTDEFNDLTKEAYSYLTNTKVIKLKSSFSELKSTINSLHNIFKEIVVETPIQANLINSLHLNVELISQTFELDMSLIENLSLPLNETGEILLDYTDSKIETSVECIIQWLELIDNTINTLFKSNLLHEDTHKKWENISSELERKLSEYELLFLKCTDRKKEEMLFNLK